jgi:hypothetical protein
MYFDLFSTFFMMNSHDLDFLSVPLITGWMHHPHLTSLTNLQPKECSKARDLPREASQGTPKRGTTWRTTTIFRVGSGVRWVIYIFIIIITSAVA